MAGFVRGQPRCLPYNNSMQRTARRAVRCMLSVGHRRFDHAALILKSKIYQSFRLIGIARGLPRMWVWSRGFSRFLRTCFG